MNSDTPEISAGALPRVGSSEVGQDVVTYLSQLCQEVRDARGPWEPVFDSNQMVYVFGDDPQPDDDDVVVNEVQNAIISQTDIQTKEPPTGTLEPVETGEEPDVYWKGPAQVGEQLGIVGPYASSWDDPDTGQPRPALPLPYQLAEQVTELRDKGALRAKWIVEVNERTVAETYQRVFDVLWDRSSTDRRLRSNLLKTNIQGTTFELYQFDAERVKHILMKLSLKQTYIDPTVEDIDDAAYAGVDLVLDRSLALKLYPGIRQEIEQRSRSGYPNRPDGANFLGAIAERQFRRPVVTMRIFWLRDQEIPLSLDEALAGRHVEKRMVADVLPEVLPGAEAERGNAGGEPESVDAAAGDLRGGDAAGGEAGESPAIEAGEHLAAGQEPATVTREAMFLGEDELDPAAPHGHPAWPCRRGIRQVITIDNVLVSDGECPFFDIPLIHNVNIPIPDSPWGLGEPFRLKGLQRGERKLVQSMIDHAGYFSAPVTSMPECVHKILPAEYQDSAWVEPGFTMIIPDDVWLAIGGKTHNIEQPPQTPPALVELYDRLKQLLTEQSGHAEVLQGRAGAQVRSGRAIELLQSSAASMIGYKSQRTGDVVYRLARLMLHSMAHHMDIDDVAKIIRDYPRHILEAIWQRGRDLEWQVSVNVSSGSGAVLAGKRNEARVNYQSGLIDRETCQEILGIDARQVNSRMDRVASQQMEQAQEGAPGAAAPAPQPGAAMGISGPLPLQQPMEVHQ